MYFTRKRIHLPEACSDHIIPDFACYPWIQRKCLISALQAWQSMTSAYLSPPTLCKPLQSTQSHLLPQYTVSWIFLLLCHCLYSFLCLERPPLPISTGQSPCGSFIVCLTKHIIDSVIHSCQTLMTARADDQCLLRLCFSAAGHFVTLLRTL